ncbi:MAG: rhamnulose-1-phosphate aldolase [Clostridia bacterium]|nr:rhamnulose-1-phosphate aldolase [Clostridia bacterium]
MKNVIDSPFVKTMCETTANMYRLGWDERNGGNISYLIDEKEVGEYLDLSKAPIRSIETGFSLPDLDGKYFIVTGTGKYFKNVECDPETNLGIVKIANNGTIAQLLWGFKDGGKFTSEFPSHMMCHAERLKTDPENRVVMHCHPTHTLAMNYVHELDEKKFTHTLWEMCTECIVVFPDGVGILPWMLCGTNEIGEATAEKMKDFRVVIWAMHGIYGAGKTMDECFGLIETIEKAAQIYMLTANLPRINTIKDEELKELAEFFKVDYRKDFLNLK